jgi:CRP-like cAMP-binding protein
VVSNLYTHLRIEECKAGRKVFNYGDYGQLFYIIIEGEVEVRTPAPVELEND